MYIHWYISFSMRVLVALVLALLLGLRAHSQNNADIDANSDKLYQRQATYVDGNGNDYDTVGTSFTRLNGLI